MKAVILAGGLQSTINNENEGIPKPMVDIGGKPLLWHIMKHFSEYGLNEFIVCGGYRVDMIKEYFMDYYIYASDITVDLQTNTIKVHNEKTEDWKVTVVDTGVFSGTGRRVSLIQKYIDEEDFIVTYGDCLSDINIPAMIDVHRQKQKIATVAMAKPTGRNRLLPIDEEGTLVYNQSEKISNESAWVNADCFIFNRRVFDYLTGNYDLEKQLFMKLSEKQQLATYKHTGYWTTIETRRDLVEAENLWNAEIAPWMKK
ncbi:MAG: sugar phosphate nucleotidyltransferase [Bacillus sp. (in: Bacteria)]|nr:sugar phosphate nucleotidyltransferase [Bacillus sp. (in: firmicutes)]MCM1426132.1 sugar phosphate nucleotidyltransferase [Eubacterium sp.]